MPSTPDWSTLAHAYGPATDIPTLVSALASTDAAVRERAIIDLEARCAHQGTAYPASAHVLPLLVERLEVADAADRPAIAGVVGLIAWSHGDKVIDAAVSAALKALAPRLLPFLDDADPEVRLALVNTFGKLASLDPAAPAAIAAHLATEVDPGITLSLAWAPHFGGSRARAWLSACETLLDSADPVRRIAGASALVLSRREGAPEAAVEQLLGALAAPAGLVAAWKRMPWTQGIDVDLANLASFLGEKRLPRVLPAIAAAMERSTEAEAVAEAMLFMAFGDGGAPNEGDALDDARREALKRLVRCDAAWTGRTLEVLGFAGLPASREELGEWLGLGAESGKGGGAGAYRNPALIATGDGEEAEVVKKEGSAVKAKAKAAVKKPVVKKKAVAKKKPAANGKRTK